MAKYTDDFKLQVINHCLNGHSYKQTAQSYGIDHKQVQIWIKLYQTHGIDAIKRRRTKTVYDTDFKLSAVQQVMLGRSLTELAIELNLPKPALLSSWLKAYQTHGIMGLYLKRKGRTPVTPSDKAAKPIQIGKTASPTDEHADLLRRIQYLEAENAYLKKLDALIRQKNQSKPETKP